MHLVLAVIEYIRKGQKKVYFLYLKHLDMFAILNFVVNLE